MSGVEGTLKKLIGAEGPLSLDRYMAEALFNPEDGYYTTAQVFGAQGDFTTAPEISQIFGELIGLWAADLWQRSGAPDPVNLVELGPGRGTLMADILRATRIVRGFLDAVRLHLVEASPRLRTLQAERLKPSGLTPNWHDNLESVPDGPMLLIANEFFDALPIRQYQFRDGQWCERRIGLDAQGQFTVVLSPGAPLPDVLPDAAPRDGDILETSLPSLSMLRSIAERLVSQGGAALIIDYGYARSAYGDTFQAIRGHKYTDPLTAPGKSDLTAHVNFALLARVAREVGGEVYGPVTQGALLSALGIEARTRQLLASARDDAERESVATGSRRLVAPDAMGDMFKVLALTARDMPAPAGFEES